VLFAEAHACRRGWRPVPNDDPLFINGLAASAGEPYVSSQCDTHLARRGEWKHGAAESAMGEEFGTAEYFICHVQDSTARLGDSSRSSGLAKTDSAERRASFAFRGQLRALELSRPADPAIPQLVVHIRDFLRDVRARGDYAIWLDTLVKGWLARRSISAPKLPSLRLRVRQ